MSAMGVRLTRLRLHGSDLSELHFGTARPIPVSVGATLYEHPIVRSGAKATARQPALTALIRRVPRYQSVGVRGDFQRPSPRN